MQKKKRKIRRICCLFLIVFGIFLQQSPCDIYASEQKEELAIKLNHFKLGEDAKEEFSPEISYKHEDFFSDNESERGRISGFCF